MTEKALDYKKEYRDLYFPKDKPVLIDIPAMNFIMVDGKDDPNNNPDFQEGVELLYGLSYTIKMSKKKGKEPAGYFDYVVPPLEGLWWIANGKFSLTERENWLWTIMIRQPEFVGSDFFTWAKSELKKKKPEMAVEKARLESVTEGLCVQIMHTGPYATEPETMVKIEDFIRKENLVDLVSQGGKHHEIYLSDPGKGKPENMKTVLRHPVKKSYIP